VLEPLRLVLGDGVLETLHAVSSFAFGME